MRVVRVCISANAARAVGLNDWGTQVRFRVGVRALTFSWSIEGQPAALARVAAALDVVGRAKAAAKIRAALPGPRVE